MTALKTLAALVATALVALQTALADGTLSLQDWTVIGAGLLGALGVYLVPNTPALSAAKAAVAALTAGFIAAQELATDATITGQEWLTIGIAALGALGVYAVPNRPAFSSA